MTVNDPAFAEKTLDNGIVYLSARKPFVVDGIRYVPPCFNPLGDISVCRQPMTTYKAEYPAFDSGSAFVYKANAGDNEEVADYFMRNGEVPHYVENELFDILDETAGEAMD